MTDKRPHYVINLDEEDLHLPGGTQRVGFVQRSGGPLYIVVRKPGSVAVVPADEGGLDTFPPVVMAMDDDVSAIDVLRLAADALESQRESGRVN